jgi:CrcB protein
MSAWSFVAVAAAGGFGALVRFGLSTAIPAAIAARFPWATFVINVSGSLALGIATGLATAHVLPADWRAVVGTGFLGGYTTFSTASVEAWRLARDGKGLRSIVYALGMFAAAVAAAGLGFALGSIPTSG